MAARSAQTVHWLKLIERECPRSVPQATHEDFANKLYGAPSVSNSKRFSKPKLSRTDFTIDHYAGEDVLGRSASRKPPNQHRLCVWWS